MLTRNQVRHISELHNSSYRRETGLYLAEGNRLVVDMIHSGAEIVAIYARESRITSYNVCYTKLLRVIPGLIAPCRLPRLTAAFAKSMLKLGVVPINALW